MINLANEYNPVPKVRKTIKPKKSLQRKSKSPLKKAKERAWDTFSLWVRRSNADSNGNVKCFTCSKVLPWKESQAGHFLSGRHGAVLFDEAGVRPQCVGCNVFGRGKFLYFYDHMVNLYGMEFVHTMIQEARQIVKYKQRDYEAIEEKYTQMINEL